MRGDRLFRFRHWPDAVYTDHLTRLWRRRHPPATTPVVDLPAAGIAPHPAPRVAVVCHVYYPDLLGELHELFANLPAGAELYASVVEEGHRASVLRSVADLPFSTVEVRVVPNRGRDIAPKYVAFADVLAREDGLLLFLHTKKTSVEAVGPGWRQHLYGSLAGSRERVEGVLALFAAEPGLGVLAPEHYGGIRATTGWHGSFAPARALARRLGVPVRRWDPPDFASGSMFWARPAALRPIARLSLTIDEFPGETGQNAYTIMHALERLVFVSAAHAGLTSAMVRASQDPALAPAADRTVELPVADEAGSPSAWLRLAALWPTLVEMVGEAYSRRTKVLPARLRARRDRVAASR